MDTITIVGATGNVGRIVTEMLVSDKVFTDYNIRVTGSARSAGKKIQVLDKELEVENTDKINFLPNEICIFNTEADVSSQYIPRALDAGAYVVDSSSYYRMTAPLIVPAVNISDVDVTKGRLFSHSNCIVSPIATVISPLHQQFQADRIIASTYQSTSGAGKAAMDECFSHTAKFCATSERCQSKIFTRPIPFNVIPQIGSIDEDGISGEEDKIVKELHKVVDKNIYISATSVRVPVLVGHSVSLSIRFKKDTSVDAIKEILSSAIGIELSDSYHTPIEVAGSNNVFVGRIRSDRSDNEQWFHMWICSDNLRVGAAHDAFLIASAIKRSFHSRS